MRQLTSYELAKLELLTSLQVEVALIEPTETGLRKSIMDATKSVRDFLLMNKVHDYELQAQGPDSKVVVDTNILTSLGVIHTMTSLYRPNTKKGDPRIWISKISSYSRPSDIITLIYFDNQLWVFNLTQLRINDLREADSPLGHLLFLYSERERIVSQELLMKIRKIAKKGFIASPTSSDTSVGRLLEYELGIPMNSSRDPDYKGIELKSARSERNNRKNLFAQVPAWEISKLKSSKQILDKYGYDRSGTRRLYCTVSTGNFNSQTLRLRLDDDASILTEYSSLGEDVVRWKMDTLQNRLITKHKETFWVEAISKKEAGIEYFKFQRIEHTRDPITSQLPILINQGSITVDHLIKEKNNSAVEKGPLFKLNPRSVSLLFPPSNIYDL